MASRHLRAPPIAVLDDEDGEGKEGGQRGTGLEEVTWAKERRERWAAGGKGRRGGLPGRKRKRTRRKLGLDREIRVLLKEKERKVLLYNPYEKEIK
jgi:hypothetical protein